MTERLTPTAKYLLIVIKRKLRNRSKLPRSMDDWARCIVGSVRAIQRAFKRLEEHGHIRLQRDERGMIAKIEVLKRTQWKKI